MSLSCTTSGNEKELKLSWIHSEVFSAPNTTATFTALGGDEPVRLFTKLYSNSYQSGFVLPQDDFGQVVDALLQGKQLAYRVTNDDFFEGKVTATDDTTALKELIAMCR